MSLSRGCRVQLGVSISLGRLRGSWSKREGGSIPAASVMAGTSLSSFNEVLVLASASHGARQGRGMAAAALGRGTGGQRAEMLVGTGQLWDEPKPHHGASELRPHCRAGPGAAQEVWAGDGVRGYECTQGSLPLHVSCWKTSLLCCLGRSSPRLLCRFIWENLPECSHRCHQPDSLCCSNKMAP